MQLIEATIEGAAGEQLLVGPFLSDPPLVHDDDPVHELDGGEAVGDDQAGASADNNSAAVADVRSKVMGRERPGLGDEKRGEERWGLGPDGA